MNKQWKKAILVLAVAICMVVGTVLSVSAATTTDKNAGAIKELSSGVVSQAYSEISSYRAAGKYTAPGTPSGYSDYVFAGWFTNEACTTETTATSGSAYAKFVVKDVLGVKAQFLAGTSYEDKTSNMRFVTTVDSLDYDEVGFKCVLNGVTKTAKSSTVYKKLYAAFSKEDGSTAVSTLLPTSFSETTSQYFMACILNDIPNADFGDAIQITPYWKTLDGTTVYGDTVVKTVNNGYMEIATGVTVEDKAAYDYSSTYKTWITDTSYTYVVQGGCIGVDNGKTYYYQAMVTSDNSLSYILKIDMESGEIVACSKALSLGHTNDITYNKDLNVLVVCQNAPNNQRISFVNPSTLELVAPSSTGATFGDGVTVADTYITTSHEETTKILWWTRTEDVENNLFSIEYNSYQEKYVVGISGGQTFRILDKDFSDPNASGDAFDPTANTSGFTTQGVVADDSYIYFVLYHDGEVDNASYEGHVIAVYDWNGNYVTVLEIPTTSIPISVEPENIAIYDNVMYISCQDKKIYKVAEMKVNVSEYEAIIEDYYTEGEDTTGYFKTLEEAVEAVQDGQTITIVSEKVSISENLNIDNANVTITNEPGVNVVVKKGADFSGILISNNASGVKIQSAETGSLTFTGNGYSGSSLVYNYADATLDLDGVTFKDILSNGSGSAVHVNAGTVTINDCDFENNTARGQGGALWVADDAIVSSLKKSRFTNNTSGTSGGAIYNTGELHMETTTFDSNDAGSVGGAINCASGVMTVDACIFDSNTAVSDGGAVQVANSSTAIFTEENGEGIFQGNTAGTWEVTTDEETQEDVKTVVSAGRGGALHTNNSVLSVSDYTFDGNTATSTGGAVNIADGTAKADTIVFDNVTFVSNKAEGNGGAINDDGRILEVTDCIFGGTTTVDITNEDGTVGTETVTVGNDSSAEGGAIYHAANKLTVTGSDFIGNESSGGGAIRIAMGKIEATIEQSEFHLNNSTGHGGAIYNSAQAYSEDAKYYLTITDCSFGSSETITDEETGKTTINVSNGNTATGNGGAIYNGNSSIINLVGNANATVAPVFADNKAEGNLGKASDNLGGGAILVGTGKVYVDGYTFNKNSATKNQGGAIRAGGSTNCTIKNSQFNSNESGASGGAIYKNGEMTVENSDFTGNKAGSVAGAINSDAKDATIRNCNFSSNESGAKNANNAGAIQVNGGEVTIEVTDAKNYTFNENKATGKAGGAIFVTGADASLNIKKAEGATGTITFVDNEAATGGAICVNRGTVVVTGIAFEGNGATNGGAIYVDGTSNTDKTEHYAGTLTASDCTFEGNTATTSGGAVYLSNAQGGTSAVINENSTFTKNKATGGDGGAIYTTSIVTTEGEYGLTVEKCIFGEDGDVDYSEANTATTNGKYGGAIYVKTGNAKIADAEFLYNHSCNGGAIGASAANDLTIDNVEFVGNKATYAGSGGQGGALRLVGATKGTIKDCVFEQNIANRQGGALALENDNTEVKVYNSKFDGNKGTNGGAIRVVNKATLYLNDNETADKGNSIFTNNQATEGQGGAIICEASNITCEIYNYTFTNNQATTNGGAISTVQAITINNVTFGNADTDEDGTIVTSGNKAESGNGGAIYATAVPTITGGNFVGNIATNGGAIYTTADATIKDVDFGTTVTVNDTTENVGNTATGNGGAVYVTNGVTVTLTSDSTTEKPSFTGNKVTGETSLGGAIYVNNGTVDVTNYNFVSNTAIEGGAITVDGDDTNAGTLSATGCTFDANTATQRGGAIYLSEAVAGTSATINGNSVFTKNVATKSNGGAIYTISTKDTGLLIEDCTFGKTGDTEYTFANKATASNAYGSAVYGASGSSTKIVDTNFYYNKAYNGGAVGTISAASMTIVREDASEAVFEGNYATNQGGAIRLYGCTTGTITGYTFKENYAKSQGGAMVVEVKGTTADINNCKFDTNTTDGDGGAIRVADNAVVKLNGSIEEANISIFTGNEAVNGGALATAGSGKFEVLNYVFTNNKADTNGGAFFTKSGNTSIIANSTLGNGEVGNSAVSGGAIYASGNVTITDTNFASNTATENGGAIYATNAKAVTLTKTGETTPAITGNSAVLGGAIYTDTGTITATGYTFNDNEATSGGAIYVGEEIVTEGTNEEGTATTETTYESGIFNATTCVFNDNEAKSGGAVYVVAGQTSIEGSQFNTNTASDRAGAIYVDDNATVTKLADSTLANNSSSASGGAIFNTGTLNMSATTFSENHAGSVGGAINCETGVMTAEDCSFVSNTSVGNGGAVQVANASDATFTVSENGTGTFQGNTAGTWKEVTDESTGEVSTEVDKVATGGAIRTNNSLLSVTGYTFDGNSATSTGGAVDIGNGAATSADGTSTETEDEIIRFNSSTFVSNKAEASGGAIQNGPTNAPGRDMTITGCKFGESAETGNTAGDLGGAIYHRAKKLNISTTSFIGNKSASNGGAIYNAGGGTLKLNGTKASSEIFQGNTAEGTLGGGAIDIGTGTLEVTGYTFEGNVATNAGGGAIGIHPENIAATITNSVFKGNHASGNGGAIINQSTKTDIALNITECTFGGTETTDGNYGAQGGAIYTKSSAVNIVDTAFVNNYATSKGGSSNGGAILNDSNVAVTITATGNHPDKAIFEGNHTSWNGGAIRMNAGTLNITGYTFKANKAPSRYGGALYIQGGATTNITDCKFGGSTASEGNTAQLGGAIYNIGSAKLNLIGTQNSQSIFANNSANAGDKKGGAIYVSNGTLTANNYTFDSNTADYGGAVYIEKRVTSSTFSNSTFTKNAAVNGGALYYEAAEKDTYVAIITDCTFGGEGTDNDAYVLGNTALAGGAIYTATNITVTGTDFVGNRATGKNAGSIQYGGGAVFSNQAKTFTFSACDFINNYAAQWGGACCFIGTGYTATFKDGGAFTSNTTADVGGALVLSTGPAATVNITGYTFTNNTSSKYTNKNNTIWMGGSTLNLYSCTFDQTATKAFDVQNFTRDAATKFYGEE